MEKNILMKVKEKIQNLYAKSFIENENDTKKHIKWLKEKKWQDFEL